MWPILRTIAVTIGAMMLSLFGAGLWVMEAPAVPGDLQAQVRRGMSEDEIRELLGDPSAAYGESSEYQSWAYSRWTWAIFYVRFDERGRVVDFNHDW